jgi:rod shape-determining protein MreD
MRMAGVLLALIAAVALQTALARLTIGGTTAVDLVLVVVVYVALAFGAVPGLVAGSLGGIIQDALAGGVVGIGGFAKTLVGFVVGLLGAQFIVSQPLPRFIMFVGATVVHEACFEALYAVVQSRPFRVNYSVTLTQAAVNAVIGVLAFWFVEKGPGLFQRRRTRGATLSRRHY